MRLTLVRHGRPGEGHAERPHDPPLHADGYGQAAAVAALPADDGVTGIVASPLLRAHETALPLAARLASPVRTVDGRAEADRHVGHDRSTETLRALDRGEWQRFLDEPVRYLGGDPEAFRAGVLDALHATADAPDDAHVVVFTHGLPINVVLSHALGLPRIVHFRPDDGSVTRLVLRSTDRIGVVSVNEGGHHRFAAAA